MKVLHVSPERNVDSILNLGILKRPAALSQFNDLMEKTLGNEFSKTKGLIFTMPEAVLRRDKYLKDFAYWKTWGTPRNSFLEELFGRHDSERIVNQKPDLFKDVEIEGERLIIFEAVLSNETTVDCLHAQHHLMNRIWSDMDNRYEHSDKPLILVNDDIKPENITAVGSMLVSINNKDKIDVTLNL